jgi:hypothetical protein
VKKRRYKDVEISDEEDTEESVGMSDAEDIEEKRNCVTYLRVSSPMCCVLKKIFYFNIK